MSNKCKKENCNAWATEDGYCFMHSPKMKDERAKARKDGGSANKVIIKEGLKSIKINNLSDILIVLEETINDVRMGKIEPKIANCIIYGSGQLLKAMELLNHLKEIKEKEREDSYIANLSDEELERNILRLLKDKKPKK